MIHDPEDPTLEALEPIIRIALDADGASPKSRDGRALATLFPPERELPSGPKGEELRRRAVALFQRARPGVLKLVLRRLGRSLEVIEALGERLEPVPARGAGEEGVLVRRRFGGHTVAAHVSAQGPASRGGFLLSLEVWSEEGSSPPRVSLFRGGRELASERPRHGRVLLPELPAGRYRVVLSEGGESVGELDLTFEDTAA